MKPFLVRIAVVAGLYVAGAVLVLAPISRAGMAVGAYGEHAGVEQICVLGALVESL